jgi:hypothetical protein
MDVLNQTSFPIIDDTSAELKKNKRKRSHDPLETTDPEINEDDIEFWNFVNSKRVLGLNDLDDLENSSCDELDNEYEEEIKDNNSLKKRNNNKKSLKKYEEFFKNGPFLSTSSTASSPSLMKENIHKNKKQKINHSSEFENETDSGTSISSLLAEKINERGYDSSSSSNSSNSSSSIVKSLNSSISDRDETNEFVKPNKLEALLKEKSNVKKNKDFCFGCNYSCYNRELIEGKIVNDLNSLIDDYIGQMDNKQLAKTIHTIFKTQIYNRLKSNGKKIPMWRSKSIYDHITEHCKDPRIYIVKVMEILNLDIKALNHMMYKELTLKNGSTVPSVNLELMKMRNELIKMNTGFYTKDPKKMLFYNEKREIKLDGAHLTNKNINKNF